MYSLSLEFWVRLRDLFIGGGMIAVFVGFLESVAIHINGEIVYLI